MIGLNYYSTHHGPTALNNTAVQLNIISRLTLGQILLLATKGIAEGGLLRWRGADLKSPLVLESTKNELSGFAETTPSAESLGDLWSIFIYQY